MSVVYVARDYPGKQEAMAKLVTEMRSQVAAQREEDDAARWRYRQAVLKMRRDRR